VSNTSPVVVLEVPFTLPNKGGEISIYEGATVVDRMEYVPALGGNGDGTSIERVGGEWVASATGGTPGALRASIMVNGSDTIRVRTRVLIRWRMLLTVASATLPSPLRQIDTS